MKKFILSSLLVFIVVLGSVFVEGLSSAQFNLQKLRYEPYPASPGEYFDLWLKVQNIGETAARNATFVLVTDYPFSLYPGTNPMQSYGVIGTKDEGVIVLEYKVKVNEDSVAGNYELKLKAFAETLQFGVVYSFNITVENVRTDFEIVVQESSADVISLAIANTGKNPANSVTVKIPEQENFRVIGVSNSIVGNIVPGDYSIVSFEIQPKNQARKANLEVQIDYTDIISQRRTVVKNVSLNLETAAKPAVSAAYGDGNMSNTAVRFGTRSKSLISDVWFWVSMVLSVIIVAMIYRTVKIKKKAK